MNKNLVLHNGMTGKEMAAVLEQFKWPEGMDSDTCYETLRFVQNLLFVLSEGDIEPIRTLLIDCEAANKT